MYVLQIEATFAALGVYGDALHVGHDTRIEANAAAADAEVLVFFDSRGISASWETSLLRRVVDHLGGRPYLALTRPLTMTTWATLYNFVTINRLQPRLIVTNMGFVDCTPKKQELCEDVLAQMRFQLPAAGCTLQYLEHYQLSNGTIEALHSVRYDDDYITALRAFAAAQPTVAIKTPLVPDDIELSRPRPGSFFAQLQSSNELIDAIGCITVEVGEFDRTRTYDAVHWTSEANQFIFEKLTPWL